MTPIGLYGTYSIVSILSIIYKLSIPVLLFLIYKELKNNRI